MSSTFDVDWVVVGSGFGGSVAALRLAEKGARVLVLERGRRYGDKDLPRSAWQASRYVWAPAAGLRGIMRNSLFGHVFSSTQTGVGGGSLVYGGVLFRPQDPFYADPQWSALAGWKRRLAPHFAQAERMLGVRPSPFDSASLQLTGELAEHFGATATFERTPMGVFFGEPGVTVADPYFGGEGPDRTGCTRCGSCLVGCRVGAANTLTKNYLWLAERRGAQVVAERDVVDVTPIGAPDGSDGYLVTTQRPGAWVRRDRRTHTARGVVFAGGAVGTNALLADLKHRGALPRISDRLGRLVRTNSEAVLAVRLPEDRGTWEDVAASSRVVVDDDTQLELLTYGRHGDLLTLFFTVLVGEGSLPVRLRKWLGKVARHPGEWTRTLSPFGASRRTMMMLVMQPRDNAITFRATKRLGRPGYRLRTEADPERPAPTFIDVGHRAISWLAKRTGGVAQSSIFEAFGNRPMTAHVVGGAPIAADAAHGVIDEQLRVFGYENLVVCDAAALPANPGVNPALTITALAEYAMSRVPGPTPAARTPQPRGAAQ